MLILSRKVGEVILVGDDIEVVVVAIDRGKVRLGFKAPKELRIDRSEVRQKMQETKEE